MSNPFWWKWPSWVVELGAGAGLQLAMHAFLPPAPLWTYSLVGLLISVGYELRIDVNGWSWEDVLQRAIGQEVGELFAALVNL